LFRLVAARTRVNTPIVLQRNQRAGAQCALSGHDESIGRSTQRRSRSLWM